MRLKSWGDPYFFYLAYNAEFYPHLSKSISYKILNLFQGLITRLFQYTANG